MRTIIIVGTGLLALSACEVEEHFDEPSHHAVVQGVVTDSTDQPLAGIWTSIPASARGAVVQTDQLGRFYLIARRDIGTGPDTLTAWVTAAQANLPPAQVIKDSVQVLLHFKPTSEDPVVVETTIRLPVAAP